MSKSRVVFRLRKLVRDKLPEMMRQMGQEPSVTQLEGTELQKALIKKIIEESAELDPEQPDYRSELSDLKQAVDDLLVISNPEAVQAEQDKKLISKGGFSEGQYVDTLSLKPDDEWVDYYRREPDKYSEEDE